MPAVGIPEVSTECSTWSEATARFRTKVTSETFSKIVEVKSIDDLFHASAKAIEHYQKKSLPKWIDKSVPFLQHLRTFTSVIDTFIQLNPQIAALIWGSWKLILEVCAEFWIQRIRNEPDTIFQWPKITVRSSDVLSEILEMFEQLCYDLPRYQRYARLFCNSRRIEDAIIRIYKEIICFCSQLISHLTRSPLSMFPSNGSEQKRYYLTRKIENILCAVLCSCESDFDQIIHRIKELNKQVDAEAVVESMELDHSRHVEIQRRLDQPRTPQSFPFMPYDPICYEPAILW